MHSFGYFNLRDFGLADKKAAVEQLAARISVHQRQPGRDLRPLRRRVHDRRPRMMQKPYNDFFKVGVSTSGNHDNNIYSSYWSETYHGLKEVALNGADAQERRHTPHPSRPSRSRRPGRQSHRRDHGRGRDHLPTWTRSTPNS